MYRISNIESVVLGLICEKPLYGYEIDKIIDERNMRNWTEIAFSSVYYVLKKLEKKKLIIGKIKSVKGKPSQKIFSVTPDGKKVMKDKVKELISEMERLITRFDLGLLNLNLLSKAEVKTCLDKYVNSIDETKKYLNNSLKKMNEYNLPENILALAKRPLAHVETEKKWITKNRNFLEEIK